MAPLLLWWFLISLLALLALPLTMALLRHLPDRGYPLARFVGILLPAFLAWMLGMWQLASYGLGLLILCLLVEAGISAWLLWKDRSILAFLKAKWRLILGYEVLFALALLAGALLRIHGPWGGVAINHTEQPMDLALTNGIIQSDTLPPHDPWLASFQINYYYLGYFLAASLTILSGIASSVTFNLNLALIFALTATGAFSLAYNLTLALDRSLRRRAVVAGLLAALFVTTAGNQVGALQALTGSEQIAPLNAGELGTVLAARLTGQQEIPLGHTVYISGNDFGGEFEVVHPSAQHQRGDFNWWWPSRVLWDERPTMTAVQRLSETGQVGLALLRWRSLVAPEEIHRSYTITEFPFFSFYLGDMHPHVMALPLTLLAIALALNVILAPERGRPALGPGRWSWFFLVLNAVVLGGLYMMNSWDFPTYLLLYGGAWVWRWRKGASGGWGKQDWKAIARDLGILLGLCLLLYLPFLLTFRSLVGSKPVPQEILQVPILGTIARLPIFSKILQTVGPVLWDKTSLHTLLIIFGLFLYPALSWLIARRVRQGSPLNLWGWIAVGFCLALTILLRFPLLILLPFIWLGWELLGESGPAEALVLLMLLLALTLLLGCELIYIRDIFESRMNTIFKFYYQVWVLLAIVGAWAVGQAGRTYLRRTVPRVVWALPLALLFLGALVYPVRSVRLTVHQRRQEAVQKRAEWARECAGVQGAQPAMQERISGDPQAWKEGGAGHAERVLIGYAEELGLDVPAFRRCVRGQRDPRAWTLDGLVNMRQYYPGDYAGVCWLWENAPGHAIVLEAVGPEWGYYSRISSATGLATILGWDGHEAQWRGGHPEALAQIDPRRTAVKQIYETTNAFEAQELLETYHVDYVFLGSLEAGLSPESRAKFAQIGTLVFEAPGVQIYQVETATK